MPADLARGPDVIWCEISAVTGQELAEDLSEDSLELNNLFARALQAAGMRRELLH